MREKRVKKFNIMLLICILGVVLGACGQKSSDIKPEKSTKTTSAAETQVKTEKVEITKEAVLSKLKNYLPQNVLDNIPNFKDEGLDNEKTLYLWSKNEPKSDNFIHKIEFVFNENGFKQYHYKNYSFDLKENKISKNAAKKMVENFAKDFISGGDQLSFVNKPAYDSLYEKDVVESWVAEKNNKEYIIMVNLRYGYVEFSTTEEITK